MFPLLLLVPLGWMLWLSSGPGVQGSRCWLRWRGDVGAGVQAQKPQQSRRPPLPQRWGNDQAKADNGVVIPNC
ncbi:MAG TPA: hypothetical protein VFC19_00130 [Candidatus Limnocylindrales bacterium]|nr:hypothetical protein [Candidatus Limnocylindrales bacterium]